MKSVDLRILFTGGGSGGHVYPLLAVAEELRKAAGEQKLIVQLDYLGPRDAFADSLRAAGFEVKNIISGKLRRYLSLWNIFDIPKFFIGLVQAFFKVFWIMPDAIFSKGGTGALPVVLAGWFYMIPIIIHESDATPGLTNLLSARFAKRIAVSFDRARNYFNPRKTALIGSPVRKEILAGKTDTEVAKETLGFDSKLPLVLIIGGSQGSVRINEFIVTNLESILKETQVLHQTGQANFRDIETLSRAVMNNMSFEAAAKTRYRAVPQFSAGEIAAALAAADVVVSRAGSGSIFEIAAFGKPAILIPLEEAAGDHQRINAYEFAKAGAAVVLEEANLLPGVFLGQLKLILSNPQRLTQMSLASQNFFKPDGASVIAQEILRLAQ